MIATPKLSQLHVETFTMGAIGFALGYMANVDKALSATVLAIATLANHLLFAVVNQWDLVNGYLPTQWKFSPEAIYTGTNAVVSTLAIFAARHFELISRRTTAIFLFVSALVFAARVKILATGSA